MLSTSFSPLVKLFGHHDANKFTPEYANIYSISSQQYGGTDINKIPIKDVIKKMNDIIIQSDDS